MRVAELIGTRRFQVVDRPDPRPGPGEILVRVKEVGICGSDLHNYAEGHVGDTPSVFPMVLGHEPTGEVIAWGEGVTGWRRGDRAVLEPAVYCYHCEYCLSGRHNICQNLRFMSMPSDPGFFRDFATLPAANVLPLPESLGWVEGTLFEPLAVVLHSMKFVSLSVGETAAVFGAGPIGLLTVAVLRLSGAGRIWVVEPVAHRGQLARAVGADAVLDPGSVDPVAQIARDTGRRGVDVAIDCAAKGQSMNQCLGAARYGGRVVVTGIPGEILVPLEFHVMRRKELALFHVRRSNHETDLALRLLVEHGRRFFPILTHRHPIEQVSAAFEQLEHYAGGVGKLTLTLD